MKRRYTRTNAVGIGLAVLSLALGAVGANAMSVELVQNGGFETGDLTSWAGAGDVAVLGSHVGVNPFDGSYMAVLSPQGVMNADLSQMLDLGSLPPSAIATVAFAFNMQAEDNRDDGKKDEDFLTASIGGTTLLTQPLNDPFDLDPNGKTVQGWKYMSWQIPVQSLLSAPLSISFHVQNEVDRGQYYTAYVDAVSVSAPAAVPEVSSTVIILGCALLALEGFRRKYAK